MSNRPPHWQRASSQCERIPGSMAHNLEIKARVPDLGRLRSAAASLAAQPGAVIEQRDTFFAVPKGRLKVREFADGAGELIAYERPDDSGPKESVYTRVACQDASVLVRALGSVLPVRGEVRKRRELFIVGRTRIHLDAVAGLGSFVELEVVLGDHEPPEVGRQEAEALMQALSVSGADLVSGAYIDLLERVRGQ